MFNIFKKPDPGGPNYASFERRMMASMVDTLFFGLLFVPLFSFGWNPAAPLQAKMEQLGDMYYNGMLSDTEYQHSVTQYFIYEGGYQFFLQNYLYHFLLIGVVVLLFWFTRRSTPGKMLLAMEVVDAKTLGQPSKWQYILRYLGYIVAVLPMMFGFIWILFDKKRQGWHDKIGGTVVVVVPGWWGNLRKRK